MIIKNHTNFKSCYIANDLSINDVFSVCYALGINPMLHIEEFKQHPEFKHMKNYEINSLWKSLSNDF